jgi:hypothetical protein
MGILRPLRKIDRSFAIAAKSITIEAYGQFDKHYAWQPLEKR